MSRGQKSAPRKFSQMSRSKQHDLFYQIVNLSPCVSLLGGLMPRLSRSATIQGVKFVLCCATSIAALASVQPAAAQGDARIEAIEQQITPLQTQLNQLNADLAARDRAL